MVCGTLSDNPFLWDLVHCVRVGLLSLSDNRPSSVRSVPEPYSGSRHDGGGSGTDVVLLVLPLLVPDSHLSCSPILCQYD